MISLLPAIGYRRQRWQNGAGWTREIACGGAPGAAWDWRVSVAEVGEAGPFSSFPACDREIVLLAGQGMHLNFADGETLPLLPPYGRQRFAGERALSASLVEGPTIDFNLIWKRELIEAQLLHRPIVGSMLFFGEPDVTWLLYVLAGQVRTPGGVLEAGDSARLEAPTGRLVIEGGGELLLAKLSRRGVA